MSDLAEEEEGMGVVDVSEEGVVSGLEADDEEAAMAEALRLNAELKAMLKEQEELGGSGGRAGRAARVGGAGSAASRRVEGYTMKEVEANPTKIKRVVKSNYTHNANRLTDIAMNNRALIKNITDIESRRGKIADHMGRGDVGEGAAHLRVASKSSSAVNRERQANAIDKENQKIAMRIQNARMQGNNRMGAFNRVKLAQEEAKRQQVRQNMAKVYPKASGKAKPLPTKITVSDRMGTRDYKPFEYIA